MDNCDIPLATVILQSQAQSISVEHPIAVAIVDEDFEEEGVIWQTAQVDPIHRQNAYTISSFLFDLIREGTTCISIEPWRPRDSCCQRIVFQCNENISQAFYVHESNRRTPLHEACLRGACAHIIKALLNANPLSALEPDIAGNYPLHLLLIEFGQQVINQDMEEIFHSLLAVDPDHLATATNKDGATALHLACSRGNIEISPIIFKLLESNPNCASILNKRRETALHLYCAGNNTSCDIAKMLLDVNPDSLHHGDCRGFSPLHIASQACNVELVCFLIRENPEVARLRAYDGNTALHLLCIFSQLGELQLPAIRDFIQVIPSLLTATDSKRKQNPLHIACAKQRHYVPVIRLLATSEAASMIDVEHYTALHHACKMCAGAEIVKLLLSVHDMAAFRVTKKQDTALHIACEQNTCSETVKLLIESNKDALEMPNDYGFTPLHCVCRAYQPKIEIIQTLLEACPSSVTQRTNGGETAIHLACASGASTQVLKLLVLVQRNLRSDISVAITNKIGNTPLHEACFRGASFENIETLAKAMPEWITLHNNAGYTPLQIVCKSGCLDERIITAFSQICGSKVFFVTDLTGHTPLHSACRQGTSLTAIRSLINAFPAALNLKTDYGDTPLHLSCLRRAAAEVVYEIAISSNNDLTSSCLEANTAGQNPIGIAIEEFYNLCVKNKSHRGVGVTSEYTSDQLRAFNVLAGLVKTHYYRNTIGDIRSTSLSTSLLEACLSLHRYGVWLHPIFIRRVIHEFPEEVRRVDSEGNYPLHIEASISNETILSLDGPQTGCCGRKYHWRSIIVDDLLSLYPDATQARNNMNEFPISLMIRSGRLWDQTFSTALRHFPPVLHLCGVMNDTLTPHILSKVSKECGIETLYQLINSKPEIITKH